MKKTRYFKQMNILLECLKLNSVRSVTWRLTVFLIHHPNREMQELNTEYE